MKLKDKQFKWLQLLYKCSELRMIRLDRNELRILDRVLNTNYYSFTYDQTTLNDLRGRYPLSTLKMFLDDHKRQNWGNYSAGVGNSMQYNGSMTIGVSSGVHPTHTQTYIRKPKNLGKPIITGTGGSGFDTDWYKKQWEHFGQFPIEMKDLRPSNNKQDENKRN